MSTSHLLTLPLVGRSVELAMLRGAVDGAATGHGTTVFLCGEAGVGKTRLAEATAELASSLGWTVATGRAYPVETGVPYAPFSDALLPILRKLDPAAIALLTRGGAADLAYLFPALATPGDPGRGGGRDSPSEFKSRLLYNFSQFLGRLAAKQPLLLVLENLHWADASSLELLHFVARQIAHERVVVLCTYNDADPELKTALRTAEQSLVALGAARVHHLEPLARPALDQLLTKTFGSEATGAREFAALLYGWTRGNPFFIQETLKALVESGRLHLRDGSWFGWEVADLGLPRTIRDAVIDRMAALSPAARALADLAAVVGTRTTFETLQSLADPVGATLLASLDELRRQHILTESAVSDSVVYDFAHPILRDTLYRELGLARARILHALVADRLEESYGAAAPVHADELAFHFARAGNPHGAAAGIASKAIKYLTAAGRSALAKYANREAADYLSAALERLDRERDASEAEHHDALAATLAEDIAQARQRLGEYDAAMSLWERARREAEHRGDDRRLAAIERRMGLASYWCGHHQDALAHYDLGLAAADRGGDARLTARLLLAKGLCLQDVGQPETARAEIERALMIAGGVHDDALLARVHRALLLLHMWTGSPELAREHGAHAIALATRTDQKVVACTSHWALAMLGGLTGRADDTRNHIAESERLVEELGSPVLRMWTAEVKIEYASATGDWESGISFAEQTLAVARALQQRALVPRLLVWTALIYFGRGDIERGKAYVDEAWALSGAGDAAEGRPLDVHSVVPVHIGRAYYEMISGRYEEAIRIGEAGLAIADRSGYVVWAVHRLLPILAESCMRLGDLQRAERVAIRLRDESERLGHPLGLAWADTCDALLPMLRGDNERAIVLMRKAITAMEAIPFLFDGSRLRRELSRRLAAVGDPKGAVHELRHAHDVFARLGAERELAGTREELRKLGVRPPLRTAGVGAHGLTGRELEVVRLVSARKSNKEVAKALGIAPRTVSTHLSNIFKKVGVASRGELADYARRNLLAEE
ncbi:MAG: AAA family ATPase [Gemmatimonadaceae bacterium]